MRSYPLKFRRLLLGNRDLMTDDAIGLLAAMSPGIIGLLCGLTVAKMSKAPFAISLLFGGIGGFLGYLVMALFIHWRDAQGLTAFFPALRPNLFVLLLIATVGCIGAHIRYHPSLEFSYVAEFKKTPQKMFSVFILLMGLMFSGQVLLQVSISPLSSWDALDLWASYAEWILRYELDTEGFRGATRFSDGAFPWSHPRHPPTVYYISAFSGFMMQGADSIRGWLVPWTFIWLCGAMVLWGFVQSVSGAGVLSALAVYLYFTVPILENHSLMLGYAEPWTCVAVIAATAVLSLAIYRRSASFLLAGLLLSLLPITLKNVGIMYTASLLLPFLIILTIRRYPRSLAVLTASALAAGAYIIRSGFDIQLAKNRYALLIGGDADRLILGGYQRPVDTLPVVDLLINSGWALLINQTFSIVILLGVLGGWAIAQQKSGLTSKAISGLCYLMLVAASILIAFALPQLLSTDYAELYASPGSDLGNSRFIMSIGPVLLMMTAFFPIFLKYLESD